MPIYYVSDSSGNDANNGGEPNPFKTIQAASNVAQPGDTILVHPGIYRERISPPRGGLSASKPILYRSIVPKQAIIRGSIPWQPVNQYLYKNIYYGPIDSSVFTDTSAIDGANPFLVPFCVTPYGRNGAPESIGGDKTADPKMVYSLGQVFSNDIMMKQCPFLSEMEYTNESWYYDISTNLLYVNLGEPKENCQIEITNQRRLFAPHTRQLRYITIDGFVIERCGNQYPNQFWVVSQNQQAGMIGTRSGRYWTIQNNIIRYAAGVGIDWGNEGGANQDLETGSNVSSSGSYGHIIQNNEICDNGAAGTASYMGKNFTFSNNLVERNNNLKFYGKKRWESAGLKIHCPTNSVISNNIIRNNYCNGIWCDQGAGYNSIFKNNLILNNEGYGLNFEIGFGTAGKVLNNIFDGNKYNIEFSTSGGCLIAHNLFLSSQLGDIHTTIFNRSDKWDSLNLEIYYNLFTSSPKYLELSTNSAIASRFLNYNQYATDGKFVYMPDTKTKTNLSLSDWVTTWSAFNGNVTSDERSIISNVSATIEETAIDGKYIVTINIIPRLFSAVPRTDISGDYFGKDWSAKCNAGPFDGLIMGSQTFVL
jgi:hypothetical protein